MSIPLMGYFDRYLNGNCDAAGKFHHSGVVVHNYMVIITFDIHDSYLYNFRVK
jgi:hypothetical protein